MADGVRFEENDQAQVRSLTALPRTTLGCRARVHVLTAGRAQAAFESYLDAQGSALEGAWASHKLPLLRATYTCCAKCPDPVVVGGGFSSAAKVMGACLEACSKGADNFDRRAKFLIGQSDVSRMQVSARSTGIAPPPRTHMAPVHAASRTLTRGHAQEKVEDCLGACDGLARKELPSNMALWTPELQAKSRAGTVECRIKCYQDGIARIPTMRKELERD